MSVPLLRGPAPGPGLLELAGRLLDKSLGRADDFDRDPAARIHSVRKQSKRLRALLRLVRSDLPGYRRIDRAVADASRRLAGMRDQRVLRQTLDSLFEWAGRAERLPPPSEGTNDRAEREVLTEFASGFRAIANGLPSWRVGKIDRDTLVVGLARTYRKARKARRRAENTGDPADFHRWRKHAKYHWYQLRFFADAAPDILPAEARAIKEVTEILGQHHDLAMLREVLSADANAFGTPVDVAFIEDAAAARQRELAALAGRIADQIFAEKPKAFARRIAAYWTDPAPATPPEDATE